jgi:hypothetical protein
MVIVKRVVFLHQVPVGVMACRQRLADTWRPVAQADIPIATASMAKLLETPVLLGDEKLGSSAHGGLSPAHSV